MNSLPEELLQHIISFLDVPPPSAVTGVHAQEPHLSHVFTPCSPLKTLALVSRKYRRLTGPVLYRCLRVSVADIPTGDSTLLPDSDSKPYQLREWADPSDGSRIMARMVLIDNAGVLLRADNGHERTLSLDSLAPADRHYIDLICDHVGTVSEVRSRCGGFLEFVARERLSSRSAGESLVVYDSGDWDGAPTSHGARIWMALDRYVDPARVVVLGSPSDLAHLISCYSDLSDAWAFHIPYQRIEFLRRAGSRRGRAVSQQREHNYREAARLASGSVLFMRYWDSIEYDEGSSLNAYGTYHYFEKRPPSVMNRASLKILGLGDWLRRFTYTAVFPHFVHFAAVLDTLSEFRALTELVLQLAPDMKSKLLDDQERIGRGNMRLQDCWSELEQCYSGVATRLLDVQKSPLFMLERFEPRDYKNQFLRELLDNIVEGLAPHWTKQDDCAWTKIELPMLPAPSGTTAEIETAMAGTGLDVEQSGVLA